MPRSDLPGQGEIPLTDEPKTLAKRKAAEPLKPNVFQAPLDFGLFGDTANQIDLEDLLK